MNNIAKPLNDTFTGLVYILKGFRIQCLAKKLVFRPFMKQNGVYSIEIKHLKTAARILIFWLQVKG